MTNNPYYIRRLSWFFIKIVLVLIVIGLITASSQPIIGNWVFVVNLLLVVLFSPLFYRDLEKIYHLGLPEFFTWGIYDIIDTMMPGEESISTLKNELDEKLAVATQEAIELELKADDLERGDRL